MVRDQLTSDSEQAAIREGKVPRGTLAADAVKVDGVISTIGFPLVGGPAGERGREMWKGEGGGDWQ